MLHFNKAYAEKVILAPAAEFKLPTNLKMNRYGLALIHIDVEGIAPSMEFFRLGTDIDEINGVRFNDKLHSGIRSKSYLIEFKGLPKGYYLFAIPTGTYQIDKVSAPYFNLPYIRTLEDDPRWRFRIYPRSFNYIGYLNIQKERSHNKIDVKWLNRLFKDLGDIEPILSQQDLQLPLKQSFGLYGDFDMENLKQKEGS